MKKGQSGFALLELSIALLVAAMSLTAYAWSKQVELRERRGALHGELLAEANNALDQYMTTYFSGIVGPGNVAGVADKMAPTIAELRSLNLLTDSFSSTPLFGGSYKTVVTCVPAPCSPDSKLSGRVWGSLPILNPLTERVDGAALASALAALSGEGGASQLEDAAKIEWSTGASTPNPEGSVVGILVARSGDGSAQFNQFLRRDGSLPMTGNLDMGGMEVDGLRTVAIDEACTRVGRVAVGPSGEVMTCRENRYQPQGSAYWKDPVQRRANLPACAGANAGEARSVLQNDAGVPLLVPRPYLCNGVAWGAMAIDVNGDIAGIRDITATGVVRADGGFLVDAKEVVDGDGYLVAANTAIEGSPCPKEGAIAKSASTPGLILSCQSSVWKVIASPKLFDTSGSVGTFCPPATYCGRNHSYKAICMGGQTGVTAVSWGGGHYYANGQYDNQICAGGVIFLQ